MGQLATGARTHLDHPSRHPAGEVGAQRSEPQSVQGADRKVVGARMAHADRVAGLSAV